MSSPSITSYSHPLDRAKALLKEFSSFAASRAHALPTTQYVQVGDVVRDCESVIVSVTNLAPDPLYDPIDCVYPRSSTFLIDIVRSCAVAYDNQGMTIPTRLEEVSDLASRDGQLLYDFAAESVDGWSSKQPWSVIWSLAEGGMQVASLQLTIGVQ
jgi:hypothetical protein